MSRIAIWMLALATAVGALGVEDPWAKVIALKHGSELRIYKKGAAEPVSANFDEANADRILIVDKKGQSAIARDEIDRLDARPPAAKVAKKLTTTTTSKTTDPDYTPHPPGGVPVPGTSTTSSVSFSGTKESFETVYRRQAPPK